MQIFGVELETVGLTHDEIQEAIEEAGGSYIGHFGYHGGPDTDSMRNENLVWKSERDGSLNNNTGRGTASEVISPRLYGKEGQRHLRKVMKKLSQKARRAGITPVNRSCGTHITLNWKNARTDRFSEQRETARTYAIREAYDYFRWAFQALTSRSRHDNIYSSIQRVPITDGSEEQRCEAARTISCSRGAVNLKIRRGCVEFRMHNGTLNGEKLINWIDLNHCVLKWAMNDNHPNFHRSVREFTPDLMGLLDMVGAGTVLKNKLLARAAELNHNPSWVDMTTSVEA